MRPIRGSHSIRRHASVSAAKGASTEIRQPAATGKPAATGCAAMISPVPMLFAAIPAAAMTPRAFLPAKAYKSTAKSCIPIPMPIRMPLCIPFSGMSRRTRKRDTQASPIPMAQPRRTPGACLLIGLSPRMTNSFTEHLLQSAARHA